MIQLPAHAEICEVGPRDGFQFEQTPIPTWLKVETIEALAEAGLPRIQAVSFVHPTWVPQMADAEEVAARLTPREGVVYSGLALNVKGVERAAAAGLRYVDLSIATNAAHARDNANMTLEEAATEAEKMIERAHALGLQPQIGLQTVWGYAAPGDTPLAYVVDLVRRFAARGVESVSLADSTGLANPRTIHERVRAAQDVAGGVPLVLHLHDTRGLGLANVYAALEAGVARFDASLGGLGGCPFIPGATGNVATEDVVYLLESLGVATGVDAERVATLARNMSGFLGKPLPGKLHALPVAALS